MNIQDIATHYVTACGAQDLDTVTDTPAGAVPIVEWLRIEDGVIRSVHLVFDRVAFQPATEALARSR